MAAPPPVLTLAVEKGPREGETRKCRVGAALRVGRVASGNDLAVRDVGASQRHLTIEFLPPPASRWAVSDLGSSNGTFINGARLLPSVPAPLSHGDLIVLGQSTVLGVSIAPDSDVKPGPRRSSRLKAAVAVVEEKQTPSVTRLSTRKMVGTRAAAAALEPSETEKEGLDAAAAVVEEESHRVVTRGGGRKKVAGAESLKEGKEEMEEAAVATLCGRRKKAVEAPELEKADEQKEEKAAVATRGRKRKKAVESPEPEKADEQKEENAVATRGRKRKKSVEFPELENADEQKEEKAAVATRGWKRKKAEPSEPEKGDEGKEEAEVVTCRDRREVAPTVAPPPLPPKTRSRRVQGRVTRAHARKAVLEEEEEVAAPREKEKSDKVAAGDEEVEGTANALEEVPVAQRGLARRAPKGMINTECAASDNGGKEINEGGGEEENGKMEAVNIEGELEDDEKGEKHAGRSSLDTITVQEWFKRMERYLPRMINEAADEMIATLEEKHRRINEYISVLGNSCDPLEIHEYCIVRSDGQSNAE